jgi:hypothetical protein
MGATSLIINTTPKEFLKEEFSRGNYKVIDLSVSSGEAYLAIEDSNHEEKYVFALVCKISFSRKTKEFYFKAMSETMHPFYYKCPKRIFDLLTPIEKIVEITGENWNDAKEWRNNIVSIEKKPKISNGTVFKLSEKIRFTNGLSYDTFIKSDGRVYVAFKSEHGYIPHIRVRLNPKKFDYTIIK